VTRTRADVGYRVRQIALASRSRVCAAGPGADEGLLRQAPVPHGRVVGQARRFAEGGESPRAAMRARELLEQIGLEANRVYL